MGAGVMKKSGGGGGGRRHPRTSAATAGNKGAPFVDVMLVLLIIFMVAAPMLTVGVPIELPDTAANALPNEDEEPLTISISADGLLLIQGTEITYEELIPKLTAIAAERTSDKVFLRADGAIAYERVAQVMGALNAGGVNNIGLVTDAGGPALGGDQGGSPTKTRPSPPPRRRPFPARGFGPRTGATRSAPRRTLARTRAARGRRGTGAAARTARRSAGFRRSSAG